MLKKLNAPLLAGGIILLILLSVIIMPGQFTKYNPYATETLKSYQESGGNFKFMTPPFAPDERHRLGTDEMGRDVISLILYGARLTIGISVVVVFFRFLISLIVGIAAAFGNPAAQGSIRLSNIIFNFVPPLIICLIILKIRFFESLPKTLSFWMFVFMLTLVGWSRVAEVVQSRAEDILRQDFIRGEISIGKSRGMIALTNVMPHIAAEMVVMAFMEIAIVLGLLMQLGAFMVFIGNLRIVENSDNGVIISKPMSFEPEWAAMMGASKTYLRSAPWLVFSPALAFFISILGFNMFGEGLRKALQAQNSKFMHSVKKVLKPGLIGLCAVLIVFAVTKQGASGMVIERPADLPKFETVRQGHEDMALWLEDYMVVKGLVPVEGTYRHKYDFEPYWITESALFKTEEEDAYKLGMDFEIAGYGNGTYKGILYDGTLIDVIGNERPVLEKPSVVLLDGSYYTEEAIEEYIAHTDDMPHIEAYIVWTAELLERRGTGAFKAKKPVIYMDDTTLLKAGETVSLDLACRMVTGEGINVFGIIPGKTDKVNDEAVVIGVEYNYESPDARENLIAGMELLNAFVKDQDKLDRQVMFAFWDGSYTSSGYGLHEYMKHPLYSPKDTAVYVDVSAFTESGTVVIDTTNAPHTRFYGWSLTQRAEKIGEDVGLNTSKTLTRTRPDLFPRGPSCIHFQLQPQETLKSEGISLEAFTGFIFDVIAGGGY